jgi:hypothetical protein
MKKDKLKLINGKFYDTDTETIIVPKLVIDVADYLSKLVTFASPNGKVETDDDWKIVVKLFEAFIRCYPLEYQSYLTSASTFKRENRYTGGYSKDKEFQHQLEIPERYHNLIKLFYPLQTYDTKFARRLAREIPVLRAV